MDAKELRELSVEELREKHRQYKEELFNLRFQSAVGQLSNTARIREVRRTIARVLTVLREKETAGGSVGARR
ncbi:50S ribosomal protein L29 [Thermanaerovibrio acidaminovorans]|jgi:large subunit ribosomal protein L29|uniref:Large ribosomal subunit protein uL29 n=1 Tax=Thermanaerovibrio acidaminovorans (strain ATCC 49978 / DSM 6589 / Su883) TaxID=525903 RepID=D1B5W7_THEAS|nr:50S ribosomal protein L29 [Thermanaerovibrio acidaminovorans]ACZ19408.1 ribosomal protein L29 [Thermanaerovibrio acidaminovorans DSM 6589]